MIGVNNNTGIGKPRLLINLRKVNQVFIMIIGYCSPDFNGNISFMDYIGCVYPEGVSSPKKITTFNHSDIIDYCRVG